MKARDRRKEKGNEKRTEKRILKDRKQVMLTTVSPQYLFSGFARSRDSIGKMSAKYTTVSMKFVLVLKSQKFKEIFNCHFHVALHITCAELMNK